MRGREVLRHCLNEIQNYTPNGGPMIRFYSRFATFLLALFALLPTLAVAQATSAAAPAPLLLRNPSLSQDKIAFRYADDIWTVARKGGEAIASSAHLNGNTDAYIIPASGGLPRRIT